MYYLVDSKKSFAQASADIESALKRFGYRSLHIYDVGRSLRNKGLPFSEQSLIFEICNPGRVAETLSNEMCQQMGGPCRITVFTENGQTKIVLNRQTPVFSLQIEDVILAKVALAIENKAIQIIDESK
jgi:uncharacterized protein (DUF302 family)